MIIILSRKTK